MLKRASRAAVQRTKDWLLDDQEKEDYSHDTTLYPWLNAMHRRLVSQIGGATRPHYAWGVLQGVSLAKNLGIPRVSIIEVGVAGGNGLVALENIAIATERLLGVEIDVYGFDAGVGLPKPQDYRDSPNLYSENAFPMDAEKLRGRLRKAKVILGPIQETLPAFILSKPAPIAFISFDVDLYSSTVQAFALLEAPPEVLLPRIHSYFDDNMGFTHGDFTGERLAIAEFNQSHPTRKVSALYGLKYVVNPEVANKRWVECIYLAHIFDHGLYNCNDGLVRTSKMDLNPG